MTTHDVTILGGGLAGLSLALQCRQQLPGQSRILVIERNRHPVPEAAFKVGESTVEVASHYFLNVLGLEDHMRHEQLPKLGLRFFFRSGDNSAIEQRLELGGWDFPPTPSYQLDRGRFENFLAERCAEQGIELLDGTKVLDVKLASGRGDHEVVFEREGGRPETAACRWIADASGRAAILKRKLGLQRENPHRGNAVWFRIQQEIKVDDWCDDPVWQQRYDDAVNPRWLSTNHLMGDGYWVWLIPLASGATSIGIVADERHHPLSSFNSVEKALEWLDTNEPQCAEKIRQHQSSIKDFGAIKHYAVASKKVFSSQRWGIVGEAGYFLDPFYSPGSDFIAYGNTYLTELIRRDLAGKSIRFHARLYDFMYESLHFGTASVYQDQYAVFGNHQVMPVKILWDYMIYWTLTGHIFCHDRSAEVISNLRHLFKIRRLDRLNRHMQQFFRHWHDQSQRREVSGMIDAWDIPLVIQTNRRLLDQLDDKTYAAQFANHVAQMETLASEIIANSGVSYPFPFRRHPRRKDIQRSTFDSLFQTSDGPSRQAVAEAPLTGG